MLLVCSPDLSSLTGFVWGMSPLSSGPLHPGKGSHHRWWASPTVFCFPQSPRETLRCLEFSLFSSRKAPGDIQLLTLAESRRSPLKNRFCSESYWMILIHLNPGAGGFLHGPPLRQAVRGAPCCDRALARPRTGRATEHPLLLRCLPALELKKFFYAKMFPISFTCLAFFFLVSKAKTYSIFSLTLILSFSFSVWQWQRPGRKGKTPPTVGTAHEVPGTHTRLQVLGRQHHGDGTFLLHKDRRYSHSDIFCDKK